MKKKLFAILLSLTLCIGLMPVSIFAADNAEPDYLVLGDSISTGYGLVDVENEGFSYLLADFLGFTQVNKAVDGNTATGIL